ncbi:hypothetical protein [Mesorhizobium sp. M0244]|uniref:hypothetical protein n=1 Tax=Mesorhizobium sp. M0244 TaxID=2956926 RepID=UPI0033393D43
MGGDRIGFKHPLPDEVLSTLCRMHLSGDLKQLEPDDIKDVCRRLLDFLPDRLELKARGRPSTDYQMAGRSVEFWINRGIPMMEARAMVAKKKGWSREKVARAHRDYRPTKK